MSTPRSAAPFRLTSTRRLRVPHRLVLALVLIAAFSFGAAAQPRSVRYNSGIVGQIDSASPVSLLVFNGSASDLVSIDVFSLTEGLNPTVSLLSPSQIPIASTVGRDGAARVAAVLPEGGTYSILVGALNGAQGEYALRLSGQPVISPFRMVIGEELEAQFAPGGESQVLLVDASQSAAILSLGVSNASQVTSDTLRFRADIVATNGGLLARYYSTTGARILIPQGAGDVFAVVSAADPAAGGSFSLVLLPPDSSSAPQVVITSPQTSTGSSTGPQPVTTPEVSQPGTSSSSGGCQIIAGPNGVNVRSGDGTNYGVITTVEPNGVRDVFGRNNSSTWFTINVNGQTGWVAGQVVTLTGNCNAVPVVAVGAAPQQPQQPQPTTSTGGQPSPTPPAPVATQEPGQPTQPGQPTATYTATTQNQPTATYTPSYTPTTEAPTAPPDSNTFLWNVDRNNGGTFSEFVSGPAGDTVDRIEMRVNLGQVGGEATRNVTVTLNCNGSGTQYLYMTLTSPNAQRYSCGQSITVRYSAPFGTGYYYVFVDGGQAYINYTLVATTAQ